MGWSDGARRLYDRAVRDGEIDGSTGQRAAKRIDAGNVVGAEGKNAGRAAAIGDSYRAQAALDRAEPANGMAMRVDHRVAQVLRGGIRVDLGAAIDRKIHIRAELDG